MKKRKYYELTQKERTADVNIYGDITSFPSISSDVSSFDLKKELDALDVDEINVYINSAGGEVGEALAIYSTLKRHKAKVTTYCDGFACSAASVIFAAGDERVISSVGLLMIHNAWTCALGNADELRKSADDVEKITQSSIEAYKKVLNISEEQIKEMMDAETWISAEEALEIGFATKIDEEEDDIIGQSAKQSIHDVILSKVAPVQQTDETVLLKIEEISNKLEAIFEKMEGGDPEDLGAGEENQKENSNEKAIAFFKSLI